MLDVLEASRMLRAALHGCTDASGADGSADIAAACALCSAAAAAAGYPRLRSPHHLQERGGERLNMKGALVFDGGCSTLHAGPQWMIHTVEQSAMRQVSSGLQAAYYLAYAQAGQAVPNGA
jgi:hypothetical protein